MGHGRIVSGGGDNSIHVYREEMTSSRAVVVAGGGGGEKKKSGDISNGPKFAYDAVAINAHGGDVNCVKWHPRDGTCLVSAGDDGAVKLWRYIRE